MFKTALLFSMLTLVFSISAQGTPDAVDQYNDEHKKTGLWTVYLDEYTNQVDPEKAIFIGYELYDNGDCVFPFVKYTGLNKITVEFDGQKGEPGHPIPLSGTHRLLYASGKPSYEAVYKDGRPVIMKAYRYSRKGDCVMAEILDYKNRYDDIDGTFYYQRFDRDNQIIEKGYYRDGDKGWSVYQE